jgi:hypothetical protein
VFLLRAFPLHYIFCRNKGGMRAPCARNLLVFLDLTVSRGMLSAALSDNTRPDTATGGMP